MSDVDYCAWVADEDAYACSGQKCSAQSIAFVHSNWMRAGLFGKMAALAARRNLDDLTVGAVLSHTTDEMLAHKDKLLALPGARLEFGGHELVDHSIPTQYGALAPTAVFVPLPTILASQDAFDLATTEIFGPFQVLTEFDDSTVDSVIEACERMPHHLTAGIVSSDQRFLDKVPPSVCPFARIATKKRRCLLGPSPDLGQHSQWDNLCGQPRSHDWGTGQPLVWPRRRSPRCRDRVAWRHSLGMVLPPRDHP